MFNEHIAKPRVNWSGRWRRLVPGVGRLGRLGKGRREALQHVALAKNRLQGMNRDTENDFLRIGRLLQDHYAQAEAVSRSAATVADNLGGEDILSTTRDMGRVLDELKEYLFRSMADVEGEEGGIASLREFLRLVEQAEDPLTRFARIVNMLRMLAVSTRIENASLCMAETGFEALSEQVDKLGVEIEERSAEILGQCDSMHKMISQGLKRVEEMHREQSRQADTLLSAAAQSLQALVERQRIAAGAAARIAEASKQITRMIGEIVTGMQFHDITRQQIEHVEEALAEAAAPAPAGPRPSGQLQVMALPEVLRLQMAQIGNTRAEVVAAVERIQHGFLEVAEAAERMAIEVGEAAGAGQGEGSSFLAHLEEGVLAIRATLGEAETTNRNLGEVIAQVAEAVGAIAGFVKDIDRVGLAVKTIALNAIIKAAHIGERGAALGVLAEAIQRLSEDAMKETTAVGEALRRISQLAESIVGRRSDKQLAETSAGTEDLSRDLGALTKRLSEQNAETLELMSRIDHDATALVTDLREASGKIKVHERIAATLEDAVAELRLAIDLCPASTFPKPGRKAQEDLGRLHERYTMERERQVHQEVFAQAATEVELFAVEPEPPAAPVEKPAEGDLGDNVELF